MWEFRRRPKDLANPDPGPELEKLFERIPALGVLYHFRWEVTHVFDTATTPLEAEERLAAIRAAYQDPELDLEPFWRTYDHWKAGILAYFEDRKTSGVVEGINNKARVITRRSYGICSPESLWARLALDINHAASLVVHTVQDIRNLISTIRADFLAAYT